MRADLGSVHARQGRARPFRASAGARHLQRCGGRLARIGKERRVWGSSAKRGGCWSGSRTGSSSSSCWSSSARSTRRCRRARTRTARARARCRLDLGGAIVEQPAARDPLAALGGGPVTREYRVAELVHALDTAAADPRIRAVALDLDIFVGGGQTAIADVGAALDRVRRARQAGRRLRHRLYRRQLPARRPCRRDLARSPGRGADRRAGRKQSLLCRPAGADRSHRPRLPGRRVQVGGRALYPQRHVARGAPAEPGARRRLVGDLAARRPRRAAARPDRGLGRQSATPSSSRRAATWRRRRCAPAWSTGSATAPSSASAWRRSPAMTTTASPAATMRSITRPGSTSIRPGDSGGEIGILTVAGNDRRRRGRAGHGRRRDGRPQSRARAGARQSAGRWWCGSIRPGGSVLASERIRRAVLAAKARGLPIVISMGSVAASGGYWVATAGDVIYRRALDDHRLDRRVRHLAELRRDAAAARHRRRRGQDDAFVGRARSAARPGARGRAAAADRGRKHLSPLHRPGRARRGGCRRRGSTKSPRGGCGAAAWPGNWAWSIASARSTTPSPMRRGGRGSIRPRSRRGLSRTGAGLPRAPVRRPRRRQCRRRAARRLRPAGAPARGDDRARGARCGRSARRAGDPGALPRMPGDRAGAAGAGRGQCAGPARRSGAARMKVRAATADDAAAIASIYAPYVAGSIVSFETQPPDAAEMARRIAEAGGLYPWFVACDGAEAVGLRLCLRLPDPARLPLHRRDHASMSPTARTGAGSGPCSTAPCCRCWRRRASPRRSPRSLCPTRRACGFTKRSASARSAPMRRSASSSANGAASACGSARWRRSRRGPEEPKPVATGLEVAKRVTVTLF